MVGRRWRGWRWGWECVRWKVRWNGMEDAKGREGEKMTKTGRIGARARARAQMGLEGEG